MIPPETFRIARETAEELLRFAGVAAQRIERGIAVLAEDAELLDAFRLSNRAVARALEAPDGLLHPLRIPPIGPMRVAASGWPQEASVLGALRRHPGP